MISWFSKKQSSFVLSIARVEYMASCSTSCEAIWLRKLMSGVFDMELDTIVILCDNHSWLNTIENPLFHDKSKHIEIQYFLYKGYGTKGSYQTLVCEYR